MRITRKVLERLIDRLNREFDRPTEPWATVDGRRVANIGNFHLSMAYGGYCVHEMTTSGGGVNTPIISYHAPARETYDAIHNFLRGAEYARGQS